MDNEADRARAAAAFGVSIESLEPELAQVLAEEMSEGEPEIHGGDIHPPSPPPPPALAPSVSGQVDPTPSPIQGEASTSRAPPVEMEAETQPIKKPRKPRSDKGKKRVRRDSVASVSTSADLPNRMPIISAILGRQRRPRLDETNPELLEEHNWQDEEQLDQRYRTDIAITEQYVKRIRNLGFSYRMTATFERQYSQGGHRDVVAMAETMSAVLEKSAAAIERELEKIAIEVNTRYR